MKTMNFDFPFNTNLLSNFVVLRNNVITLRKV